MSLHGRALYILGMACSEKMNVIARHKENGYSSQSPKSSGISFSQHTVKTYENLPLHAD